MCEKISLEMQNKCVNYAKAVQGVQGLACHPSQPQANSPAAQQQHWVKSTNSHIHVGSNVLGKTRRTLKTGHMTRNMMLEEPVFISPRKSCEKPSSVTPISKNNHRPFQFHLSFLNLSAVQ
jgi:hypothetical protein